MSPRFVRVQQQHITVPGIAELAVVTVQARAPGPVAVLTANLHGDECTGVGVLHRLRHMLPEILNCGTVHLYPSLNPSGLREGSRGVPGDDRDPNRSFPGAPEGSMAERLAHGAFQDIMGRGPDLLVDLHTDALRAMPYAILDRVVRGAGKREIDARCHELALASGLTVLHEYPRPRYLRYNLDHSLPGSLVNGPGVAAVTLEVGPRRALDPVSVDTALTATLGVLTAAGLVDWPAPMHATRIAGGPWRRESGPRVGQAGVLEVLADPGVIFPAGEIIARVRSLDGRTLQELAASEPGFVVAVPDRCWVAAASACATLAVRDGV